MLKKIMMKKYTEQEKEEIWQKAREIMDSGKPKEKWTRKEYMIVTLPSVGFNQLEANFIVAMSLGELPLEETDENGRIIKNMY